MPGERHDQPQEVLDNILALFRDMNTKMGSVLEAQRTLAQDQATIKGQMERISGFLFGDGYANPGVTIRLDRLESGSKAFDPKKLEKQLEELEDQLKVLAEWRKDIIDSKKQWPAWIVLCTIFSAIATVVSAIVGWKALSK